MLAKYQAAAVGTCRSITVYLFGAAWLRRNLYLRDLVHSVAFLARVLPPNIMHTSASVIMWSVCCVMKQSARKLA